MGTRVIVSMAFALALSMSAMVVTAQTAHSHHNHGDHSAGASGPAASPKPATDARRLVRFPAALRQHTLANMRDHLQVVGLIQQALGAGQFDQASDLAEQRLGMTSLSLHGAHEVSRFMPPAMQSAGLAMHRAASQFALVARDAAVTTDLKPAMTSLAALNQTCVACHASFRLY